MRNLLAFLKKYDYIFIFLLLEVLAVVLMVRNSYYQSAKIVTWGNNVAGGWYNGMSSLSDYFGLRGENDRLAKENALLRAQMASSYINYTDSIFIHNDTVYKQRFSYQAADVIKSTWTQQRNYIMINKGSLHGIRPDMAVISPQGIVGVVVNVTRNFSTVMPVLHPDSRNSVKFKRTNSNGSLEWDGVDYRYASVVDIPTTYKLYKNDTIITSGLSNDFPEGILVGYVTRFSSISGSGFYNIRIRLATEFNKLQHVYVVDNRFRQEQDSLMNMTAAD